MDKNETPLSLAEPYHEDLQIGLVTRMDTLRPPPSSHIVIEPLSFGQSEPEPEYERANKQMLIIIVISKHYLVLENTRTKSTIGKRQLTKR